jgi:hypothetical protein
MPSVVVRLPEELIESARRVAALQGRQPADALADAWGDYLDRHRVQIAKDFEETARLLREGNMNALTAPSNRRAGEAAESAGQ